MRNTTMDSVDKRTKIAGENRLGILAFTVNNADYALNVFKIREIIPAQRLSKIPGANPNVLGLSSIRSEVLSVIDLQASMGLGKSTLGDDEGFFIVTEFNQHVQAMKVQSVKKIENICWSDVEQPPSKTEEGYLTGITLIENRLVGLVDVEKILTEIHGNQAVDDAKVIKDSSVGDSRKIMIVDDSLVARRQVERCVIGLGFIPSTHENGKKALQHLNELVGKGIAPANEYVMMITDIEMPQMDGYTLTSEVKNSPALSALKVVMHSSLSGVFNEALTASVGADHFLSKYDPEVLQGLIKKVALAA